MRFYRDVQFSKLQEDNAPPANKPVPMRPQGEQVTEESEGLADLKTVAQRLRISTRYVQQLVKRKIIPVIRLGRRCTRFDLPNVLVAIKKYEIHEVGRHTHRHSPRVS